jgi:hypothetical protein
MSWWRALTIVAALSFAGLMASPASAAPSGLGTLKGATTIDSSATKVHWRRYRHCHWRHGRRHCHGRRHYRSYGWGPSFGIYFGSGKRHHRHHRRHHRRRH